MTPREEAKALLYEDKIARARAHLEEIALKYGEECDRLNYPALWMLVKQMKHAARRLRWAVAGIDGDPRPPSRRGAR